MTPSSLCACLVVLALALMAGCAAGDDRPCAQTLECFKGQVCASGACVYPSGPIPIDADQGMNTTTGGTNNATGACTPPPGDTCADDAQEIPMSPMHHVVRPTGDIRYVGCSSFADNATVQGLDVTLQGTLCAGDSYGDTYGVEFGWCRAKRTQIAMTLTLDEPCADADLQLVWDALCEDMRFDCQTTKLDARTWRVTATVPTSSANVATQFVNLRIKPQRGDLQVGYTLRVRAQEATAP